MARRERLVLVDGSWLVFRAFFAIPPNLSTVTGLHTNATYGFATMFRKLMQKRPEYGAVVFDAPGKRLRDEKYPAYKGTRPQMAGELREQLPWIDKVVEANRFPVLRAPGHEADDVIGTLAKQAKARGLDVIVVAGDKDFAQLVDDDVKLFDPMKDVTYDADLVFKKWGVRPDQIVDLLALLGDTVDNIPGVSGIGQKGATTLLEKYGSLEGVYEHLDELKGKQKEALEAQRDVAFLSKDLATIVTDVPLDVGPEALRLEPVDAAARDALYRELEFNSLLSEGAQATQEAAPGRAIASAGELRDVLASLTQPVTVVPLVDAPTTLGVGAEPPTREGTGLAGLAVSDGATSAWIPIEGDQGLGVAGLDVLRPWLEDAGVAKATHDAKQLWKACHRLGIALGGVAGDTMLASFLVDPQKCIPHRLEQVSKEYLQRVLRPAKSVTGSGQKERTYAEVPVAEAASYAVHLADAVAALWPVLSARLDEEGHAAHYRDRELPLAFVLGKMELDGILVDRADLGRLGVEFTARKEEIERRIYEIAGHEFNVGSTQQLATVLFEELKLPVVKKTKTGYSTDAEVLERLAPKHEIAKLLLDQRSLAKLINTYTDVLQAAVSPLDGRIHATFQQTVGVSGRLISTDPDLQRTPVRTPEGKRIRRAFVAPEGLQILSADWSQIELRVLAHFSKDERLQTAFRENADVHRRTAATLFGVAPEDVTPEQRNTGKTINFATIYGQGATALGQILGIPRKEAAAAIETYFATYAGVREWLDRTIEDATAKGYVTTLLGRRRYIPELSSNSPMDKQAGERIAANTPIQGSAADLCKLAMLAIADGIARRGMKTRMLLQVHDELVFEVPDDEVDAARALVTGAMEHPWPLDVPLVVNVGVGRTWADAH